MKTAFKYGFFGCLGVAVAAFVLLQLGTCALLTFSKYLNDSPLPTTVPALSTRAPEIVIPNKPAGGLADLTNFSDRDYNSKINGIVGDLSGAVRRLTDKLATANAEGGTVGKAKVKAALSGFSSELMDISMKLMILTPPNSSRDLHGCLSEAVDLLSQGSSMAGLYLAIDDVKTAEEQFQVLRSGASRLVECGEISKQ